MAAFAVAAMILLVPFKAVLSQTLCLDYGPEPFNPDVTIGTNSSSETYSSGLSVSGWTDKKIRIHGAFIIDDDFVINRCTIRLEQDALINVQVEDTEKFTSRRTKYFGCAGWQGIAVHPPTTGIMIFVANQVEDAESAIAVKTSAGKIMIFSNVFNRNRLGIYAQEINLNAVLFGNTFDCTSPLFDLTARSDVGIKLDDCGAANVGTASLDSRNFFQRQKVGIALTNSSASITHATFEQNAVTGLKAEDKSHVTVKGSNSSGIVRTLFKNNLGYDIFSRASWLDVRYCKFEECDSTNILSVGNLALEQIFIRNNDFEIDNPSGSHSKLKKAVILERTAGGGDFFARNKIRLNTIDIADFGEKLRGGIDVTGFPGTTDAMEIDSNFIEMNEGGGSEPTGFIEIAIEAAPKFMIRGNTLHSLNAPSDPSSQNNRWGLFFHDGNADLDYHTVRDNTILGNPGSSAQFDHGTCAMHMERAHALWFCNNTTDQTYRGMHFSGNCGQSKFYVNNIGYHAFEDSIFYTGAGLMLEPYKINDTLFEDAFLGNQTCRGNIWTSNNYPAGYAALFAGLPDPDQVEMNQFIVKINELNQNPFPRLPVLFWFTTSACSGNVEQCRDADESIVLNERDAPIILDNQTHHGDDNPLDWEDKRQLMKKLSRHTALQTVDTPTTTFYNQHWNSSPGLYARFDRKLDSAMTVSTALQTAHDNTGTDLRARQAVLDSLDATVRDSAEAENLTLSFYNYRAGLLAGIAGYSHTLDSLRAVIDTLRGPLLNACALFNTSLPDTAIYERNQKFINALLIKHGQSQSFTSAEYDSLHAIARHCPEIAGATRSRAINLLPAYARGQYRGEHFDYAGCVDYRTGEAGQQRPMEPVAIRLAPNPATDQVQVEFAGRTFSGTVSLLDVSGRVVASFGGYVEEQSLMLPVVNVESGVYILLLRQQDGSRTALRLVVSH